MMKILPTLALPLPLLFATTLASAADPAFYVVSIGEKGDAVVFSDDQRVTTGVLPYVSLDQTGKACCFKAGARRGAGKAAKGNGDGEMGDMMSDEDKSIFRQAGYIEGAAKPMPDIAYGIEGMQSVARKGRDFYRVALGGDAAVFLRSCYTVEGVRLKLFRQAADKKPYASYYYYLGYEVEPTCR